MSYIRKRTLAKESIDPPWGVTNTMKKVGLLYRVSLPTDSMASARALSPVAKGSLWSSLVSARKSVKLGEPHCYTKRGWKQATKFAKLQASLQQKNFQGESLQSGHGDYLGTVSCQSKAIPE